MTPPYTSRKKNSFLLRPHHLFFIFLTGFLAGFASVPATSSSVSRGSLSAGFACRISNLAGKLLFTARLRDMEPGKTHITGLQKGIHLVRGRDIPAAKTQKRIIH